MREFLQSFQKLEFDKIKQHISRYAVSTIGRELIDKLTPSSDIGEIRTNLELVTEIKNLIETGDPLPIEVIPDVRVPLQRSTIEDFILSGTDLHQISQLIRLSRLLNQYFTKRKSLYPLLASKFSNLYKDNIVEYNINRAIDDDGNVKSSASKELATIRQQIANKNQTIKQSLEKILKSIHEKEWTQEDIITTRDGRLVIPVKVEHKNKLPGFIHSVSASGATVFIEPIQTLELNNEIRSLYVQEEIEIKRILKELTLQVREIREILLESLNKIGELDFLQAKGKYSIEVIGSEPRIFSNGTIKLIQGYHPLLLLRHKRDEVVPLTITIPPELKTIIITGPNAGGKSVAMKTIAILTILAQAGCHIPASPETELKVFTSIFVDIGDEQSIENDLSSFSSHLQNMKIITENADENSLVLIDEIGSGTDPIEGASLASAIIEHLSEAGSLNIVTTHHGALKTLGLNNSRIQNAAMEFNLKTLQPTYKLRVGIPGSSYAIEMANRMSLPKNIIERSLAIKGTVSTKLENLLIELENKAQELRSKLEEINADKSKLNQLNLIYENKITSLEKEVKDIKVKALHEAKNIVNQANRIIEKTVKEIKESSAGREVVRKAKQEVQLLKEEFNKSINEISVPPEIFTYKIGDNVRLKDTKSIGKIINILDDEHYLISAGDLKIKVKSTEIEPAQSEEKKSISRSSVQVEFDTTVQSSIDLRGMYGNEAIEALDKFIDNAILNNLHRIDVIHGKGTGALRKKIEEYLKTQKNIKSFRLGEWNEGGTGVTVVEL